MNIHMNTHMLSVTCSIRICDTIHWITHTLVAYIQPYTAGLHSGGGLPIRHRRATESAGHKVALPLMQPPLGAYVCSRICRHVAAAGAATP